jgi:hypothetical protein
MDVQVMDDFASVLNDDGTTTDLFDVDESDASSDGATQEDVVISEIDIESICTDRLEASLQQIDVCGSISTASSTIYFDAWLLQGSLFRMCDVASELVQISVNAGRLMVNSGASCIDKLDEIGGCSLVNEIEDISSFRFCDDLFVGLVGEGGTCYFSRECGDGMYCSRTDECPGLCVRDFLGSHFCLRDDDCPAGYYCSAEGLCEIAKLPGDSCQAEECLEGNACLGGVCLRILPWNEVSCGPTGANSVVACPAGYRCSLESGTGVCVPLRTNGEDCVFNGDCLDSLGCVDGVCGTGIEEGGTCNVMKPECVRGSQCIGDVCSTWYSLDLGDSCLFGFSCSSGLCLESVCTAAQQANETGLCSFF